jgi:[ribosomal protein S5]-alanine N-acetyltransferase
VSLHQHLAAMTECWRPEVVARPNGQEVKVVRLRGEFVWHRHADEDEFFLCIDGRFRIEFRDGATSLSPGECLVVPRGVEHRPVADGEASVLVVEPAGVRNTGDVVHPTLTAPMPPAEAPAAGAGAHVTDTARLSLQRLCAGDAAFILALLNEPSFIRNIGDRRVRTLDDARAYIANGPGAMYAAHGFGLFRVALRDSDTPIGICGLLKRDTLPGIDIGFAFLPDYQAQGYAYESAVAVRDWAMSQLPLTRLLAIVQPGNARSCRLLGKLGFRLDGRVRLAPDGEELELFVYEV